MADPVVFAEHYRKIYRRLTLVAAGVTGEPHSAEDIVQDAAVIAFKKIDSFLPGSHFGAWLAQIVRRCALNHRRKLKSRKTYATDPRTMGQLHQSSEPPDAWPISPDSGALVSDQASFDDQLLRGLNLLSEEARSCLLLRVIERLSYAEIASLMRIPEGTAMSHVHRSKAALRKMISGGSQDRVSGPGVDQLAEL
jgi:RNA polymerase sigma-70 factor (ECF subfamily)